ncbi:hypothetical protein K227x_62290 [Rubripirellula lacrimiformis]|uniref:Uncharacterized protein n=1 Tax=Rubripirellula lacrimiformis TaxID=1930273 RepID=A0A517NL00_9BACT|nr:hypothetical protein [Rubripirellula lacrimiformis]QDT07801.1 hypothetical protein K227x_62290 [Rubripirellula lacrimiformis]
MTQPQNQSSAAQYELRIRIEEIDRTIDAGVTSVTVDGTTTKIDIQALKDQRRYLQQQLAAGSGRRPLFTRIKTSGA